MTGNVLSNSEKSQSITRYDTDTLAELGDKFDKEAAEAARAKEKESTIEKEDFEELAYQLGKTNKYMEMMNEALEKNAGPAVTDKIKKKLDNALNTADRLNDNVKDENFDRFMTENARPF